MKKLLKKAMITMCSAVMFMGIGAVSANAAETNVGDFTVKKTGYGSSLEVSISGYNGAGGEIELPTTAEFNQTTYQITSVDNAFANNENVTGVIIPEGYTYIGVDAFSGCTSLKTVEIPGSVTIIGTSAFSGCTALDTVNFDNDTAENLTINMSAFANCSSLTAIELPARFSSTRYNFLYGCDALTSITIKEGAKYFAAVDNILYKVSEDTAVIAAYPGGKTDTEFTIPSEINGKTVASTAMHLFRNNAVLKKVTVPATVTNLGGFTFNGMKAIEEIILEHETAPTLGSSVCTEMKSGSKIIVKNDEVAAAFTSAYYTPKNTTVQVGEEKNVSAGVSVSAEPELKDGKAVYGIYLDSALHVNTVLLKVSFDSAQVSSGEIISANNNFTPLTSNWTEEKGKLVLKAHMGILGNVTGFSSDEKTKLAEISVPLKDGVKGNITAEISDARAAGVISTDEDAMNGTVTINTASASVFIPCYDVNNDGTVDIIDITEAQRYYKATSSDESWTKAQAMDVNGDNVVDIQDYIDIFNNLSDF